MDFPQYKKLKHFLKTQKVIDGFEEIEKIPYGGSSYNFCVKTTYGSYLLKLIRNVQVYNHLKLLLEQLNQKGVDLKKSVWQDYYLLTMPFYDGHKLRYKDCSDEILRKLWLVYAHFLENAQHIDLQIVHEKYDLRKNMAILENELKNSSGIFGLILHKYWGIFKLCLQKEAKIDHIIHGDFTENNILINRRCDLHIVDFDFIRHGNIAEDLCCLILQLSGFRGLYGNIWRFKRLYTFFQTMKPLEKEDWLYGVRLFYLEIMRRRLNPHSKTLHSFRKKICLIMILFGYFRIERFLQKSIT